MKEWSPSLSWKSIITFSKLKCIYINREEIQHKIIKLHAMGIREPMLSNKLQYKKLAKLG